jgi:hypothetical protein
MNDPHTAGQPDRHRQLPRLLAREAAEATATAEIRMFYGGTAAPLPDGVALFTEQSAADEAPV